MRSTEESEVSDTDNEVVTPKQSTPDSAWAKVKTLPASVKKLEQDSGDSSESSSEDQSNTPEGFRFVDIAILRAIFVSFLCPLCRYGHIVFKEDQNFKKGFATLLVLKCASRKCKYSKSFYTSAKIDGGQAFEVNRRIVLATRNIGIGHQGVVKFAGVMNMLTPMNENSYRDHVTAIRNAAKTEAKRSMANAAREAKEFYEPEDDGIYNIGVSGDGTWRRRGYLSAYGVVTASSTVAGKVLDVEIMSKECRECMVWRERRNCGFSGVVGRTPTSLPSESFWFIWVHGCLWHAFYVPAFCGSSFCPLHGVSWRW